MPITVRKASVTLNGSGAGTVDTDDLNGFMHLLTIDYTDTDGNTDVVFSLVDPPLTFLTITNSNTDATILPRFSVVTTANAAITDGFDRVPIRGKIRMTVSGGTAAGTVAVTYFIEG